MVRTVQAVAERSGCRGKHSGGTRRSSCGDCQDGQKNTSPHRFYGIADRFERHTGCKGFWDSMMLPTPTPPTRRGRLLITLYSGSTMLGLPHRENGSFPQCARPRDPRRSCVFTRRYFPEASTPSAGKSGNRGRIGSIPSFYTGGHPQRMYNGVEWDYGLKEDPIAHQVTEPSWSKIIEIPIEVGPDTPREFAVQEKQPNTGNAEIARKTHNAAVKENGFGIPQPFGLDWFELEPPRSNRPKIWKQRP